MAQISLILMRIFSLWFGLHPLNLQLKTWNLKMGWVFVAPMSQTGRQTESEGWKLELGQIWLEMWERATNQSTSRFTAIFTLLHFYVHTEKKKDCSKFVLKSENDFKTFSISRHLLDYFCSKLATCLPPLLHLWTHINLSWQTSNTDN